MNTRNKIISLADLPGSAVILVIGAFDPLLACHSERLAQLAGNQEAKLAIAITDPLEPLLERQARLEMVAALRVVDFVLPHEPGLETAFPWIAIHDDTALHARWSADFKDHVRRRSHSA